MTQHTDREILRILEEVLRYTGRLMIVTDENDGIIYSNFENPENVIELIKKNDYRFLVNNYIESGNLNLGRSYKYYLITHLKSNVCDLNEGQCLEKIEEPFLEKQVFLSVTKELLAKSKKSLIILIEPLNFSLSELKEQITDITYKLNLKEFKTCVLSDKAVVIFIPFDDEYSLESVLTNLDLIVLPRTSRREENRFLCGVALYPDDGVSPEELIEKAAKDLEVVSSILDVTRLLKYKELSQLIERALNEKLFKLLIQPYFDSWNLKPVGGEFLVRIVDRDNRVYNPGYFIDFLERSPYIFDFEIWLIDEAVRIATELDNLTNRRISLSLNLTLNIITNPDFLEAVLHKIKNANLKNIRLVFEFTEREIMDEFVMTLLMDLKSIIKTNNIPIDIAIDDFGTGYTSLKILSERIPDIIKIDRELINGINISKEKSLLVTGLSIIAGKEGIITVAEGVEEKLELDILRCIGIDYIQGYLLSKPISLNEFKSIINL